MKIKVIGARLSLLPIGLLLIAAAPPTAFGTSAIADNELAGMRGGFSLPSGIEVAIAVQTDTLVNGNIVLRSAYVVDQGAPQLSVLIPPAGKQVPGAGAGTSNGSPPGQTFTYERQTGLVVMPRGVNGPSVTITTGERPEVMSSAGSDLMKLEVAPGTRVTTDGGIVSVTQANGTDRVRLQSDLFETNHFFGSAFGSLTANRADDVSLDTVTTVGIELGNVRPETLGSSLYRVEGLALDSTRALSRGGL